ncbi:UNVERIFIED_CONTAM: hypothetical protein Slati_0117100 [Sesamum latifolium]|uniref:Integrase catalytic domain-containing protein n=1 Tax=Sesamum latifolium TaxID=2727402 RepID=A0AAW2Y948_9LAMI
MNSPLKYSPPRSDRRAFILRLVLILNFKSVFLEPSKGLRLVPHQTSVWTKSNRSLAIAVCPTKGFLVIFPFRQDSQVGSYNQIRLMENVKTSYPIRATTVATASPSITHLQVHRRYLCHHARLGHISKDRIRRLVDSNNLEIDDLDHLPTCESCLKRNLTKKPFVGQSAIANGLLDLVHIDVCGPLSTPAKGGFSYFITFTHDHSRYGYVYLMRYKSEAFGRFKEYRLEVENQTSCKIKAIRSDRGGEYLSGEFIDYLKENGILSQRTPPRTPQRNGVAERRNRTLMNMVRSMMSFTELPPSFWGYTLETT